MESPCIKANWTKLDEMYHVTSTIIVIVKGIFRFIKYFFIEPRTEYYVS